MALKPPRGLTGVSTGWVSASFTGHPEREARALAPNTRYCGQRLSAAPTREGYAPGSKRPQRPPPPRCPRQPSSPCPTLLPEPAGPRRASLSEKPSEALRAPAPGYRTVSLKATAKTLQYEHTRSSRESLASFTPPTARAPGPEGLPRALNGEVLLASYVTGATSLPSYPEPSGCVPELDEIK